MSRLRPIEPQTIARSSSGVMAPTPRSRRTSPERSRSVMRPIRGDVSRVVVG